MDVAVVDDAAAMEAAVARHRPELIVCPMLKTFIPDAIWRRHRCLVVHPGPLGDRGPSSLDWAIELGAREWGVTVLEATGEPDGGDVWATRRFPMRDAAKTQPLQARGPPRGDRGAGGGRRQGRGRRRPGAAGRRPRPAADAPGRPRDRLGHRTRPTRWSARSAPPRVIPACSTRSPACRSTCSAPIARTRCAAPRARSSPREPARSAARPSTGPSGSPTSRAASIQAAGDARARARGPLRPRAGGRRAVARAAPAARPSARSPTRRTARVGYLHFDFYNGAMSTEQCRRLRAAYVYARVAPQTQRDRAHGRRPTSSRTAST